MKKEREKDTKDCIKQKATPISKSYMGEEMLHVL